MPVITHNTLNAAAQPIERDTSVIEGFTTEKKSENSNLLGDLEAPPSLESSQQVVLYFCHLRFLSISFTDLVFRIPSAHIINFRK